MFQSAMRIFCCSNAGTSLGENIASGCFNPRCGFFAVRTTCGAVGSGVNRQVFQSAMRIFCCSNPTRARLWRRYLWFQSAMRIFCCSNHRRVILEQFITMRFNPRCGFFAVRTLLRNPVAAAEKVSIRDADFLLFERQSSTRCKRAATLFQSAMRIFCCSNCRSQACSHLEPDCFNPRCGFFAVRTPRTLGAAN